MKEEHPWYPEDEEEDFFEEEMLLMEDEEEKQEHHKDRMRFAAGMSDFAAVIVGVAVALALVLLSISLISWLKQDIASLFLNLEKR